MPQGHHQSREAADNQQGDTEVLADADVVAESVGERSGGLQIIPVNVFAVRAPESESKGPVEEE